MTPIFHVKDEDAQRLASREGEFATRLKHMTDGLMERLIENEINSAYIFVGVARTAYRAAKFAEGNAALSKAEAIHVQASELAQDSSMLGRQAIADHLRELRAAIDSLMTGEGKK